MSTTIDNAVRVSGPPRGLGPLSLVAARRYARHPIYRVGTGLCLLGLVQIAFFSAEYRWDSPLRSELYLGIGGIFVGVALARQEKTAEPLLATTPIDRTTRTFALFAACAVPAVTAGLIMALGAALERWRPIAASEAPLRPSNGPITDIEYLAWLIELGPVAAFGGAALGVLVGRRFEAVGGAIATALGLIAITVVAFGVGTAIPGVGERWWAQATANGMPVAYWEVLDADLAAGQTMIRPGSPIGHLLYAIALCGLVIVVGAIDRHDDRRRWWRWTSMFTALAVAGYSSALAG